MCGIAGYFYFSKPQTDSGTIIAMSREIQHRGPDDEGFVLIDTLKSNRPAWEFSSLHADKEIKEKYPVLENSEDIPPHTLAMAHRRFSIIEITAAGHQPMWDEEKNLCVVFNGEIFNYIELRRQLQAIGIKFHTDSDTEVLLAAYKTWGNQAFSMLSGFWALALYDRRKNSLILSRDRIGKKPLYIYQTRQGTVFASEMKAILKKVPPSSLNLNPHAFENYLFHGVRDLHHETFWKEIHMLDKAGIYEIQADGSVTSGTFWQIPELRWSHKKISFPSAVEQLRELFTLSLKERLRADVPIAFELSGGMDSSALVALRASMSQDPFSAFTVKYADKEADEYHYAKMVADHYPNIQQHLIDFKEIDMWAYMTRFIHLMEEPVHSPNIMINHLLRKQIRQHDFRVIIAGSGGDEVLAGYMLYVIPIMKRLLKQRHYIKFIKNFLFYKEKSPLRFKPLSRIVCNKLFGSGQKGNTPPSGRLSYEYYMKVKPSHLDPPASPKEIEPLMIANMKDLKMHYWMSSGDKAAMGIPIETRFPFLDYRVVEFVFSLPVPYLMDNGWLKWLQRKAVEDLLPKEIVWRKEKMGFPFPMEKWLQQSLPFIKGILQNYQNPWIDNKKLLPDVEDFILHDPYFLWRAVNFQLWYSIVVEQETIVFDK